MKTAQSTLSQITKSLETCDTFSWSRGDSPRKGDLTVYHDDIPNDNREIVRVKFTHYGIRVERRRLRKYDPVKHCWNEYNGGTDEYELPTRAGEKALRTFVSTKAKEITGVPNPSTFTWYKGQVSRY